MARCFELRGARAAVVLSSVLFFQLSRIFGDYLLVVPGWLFQGGAEPILVPWNTLNELIKCSCSVLGPEALQLLSSLRDVLKETRIIRFNKGQLISKCLFEVFFWTKIPTKNLIISALEGPGQKLSKFLSK